MWQLFIGGTALWYSFLLYLKYQFIEVNQQIERSLKDRNIDLLFNAISKHNSLEKNVKKLNKMYKIMIFLVYIISSIAINLSIFILHGSESAIFTKILFSAFGISSFIMPFILNYMCASVTKRAHNSGPLIFRYLLNNRLSLKQKLKIETFISRLSGPEIGFYCLDLFVMNNTEFFDYCCQLFSTYLLLIRLF